MTENHILRIYQHNNFIFEFEFSMNAIQKISVDFLNEGHHVRFIESMICLVALCSLIGKIYQIPCSQIRFGNICEKWCVQLCMFERTLQIAIKTNNSKSQFSIDEQ